MTAYRDPMRLVKLKCNSGADLSEIAVKVYILVNVSVCVFVLLSQRPELMFQAFVNQSLKQSMKNC